MKVFCHTVKYYNWTIVWISQYLLGHDPLDHSPHPGSLRIQANLLACSPKSSTATPSRMQTYSQFHKANQWQNLRLSTMSRSAWDEGFRTRSYMISVSSQWELGGISSTLLMWRPMCLLSVWMQRQCCSTPRLLLLLMLIPARDHTSLHSETVLIGNQELMHWGKEKECAY